MSTYEKIASVIIGILLIVMSVFSYREFKEPPETSGESHQLSGFDESFGSEFKIGPFVTLVDERHEGGLEKNCEPWKPVIIATLHDIKERLESHTKDFFGDNDTFEVNEEALQLFCQRAVVLTMADNDGNKLVLEKKPFTRGIPEGGNASDVGTKVVINASVIPKGDVSSGEPTTSRELLIPDRYLDMGDTISKQ